MKIIKNINRRLATFVLLTISFIAGVSFISQNENTPRVLTVKSTLSDTVDSHLMQDYSYLGYESELFARIKEKANTFANQFKDSSKHDPHNAAVLNFSDVAQRFYQLSECDMAYRIYVKKMSFQTMDATPNDWETLAKYSQCANSDENFLYSQFLYFDRLEKGELKNQQFLTLVQIMAKIYADYEHYQNDFFHFYAQIYEWNISDEVFKKLIFYQENSNRYDRKQKRLVIHGIVANSDAQGSEICLDLSFYFDLDAMGDKLQDYFRFKPNINPVFRQSYHRLCISGATWSTDYQVTLLKGLIIDGKTLLETQQLNVQTPERPSAVWFNQQDYILSQSNLYQLPIQSINLSQAFVSLYRIPEQNLQSDFFRKSFKTKLNVQDREKITQQFGEKIWSKTINLGANKVKNKTQQSIIDLPKEKMQGTGVYVLIARVGGENVDKYYSLIDIEPEATQWIIVSDIGLTTFKGKDGLTIMAHSLSTSKALVGLKLSLFSQNNQRLTQVISDEMGRAFIPQSLLNGQEGKKAVHLTAVSQQHGFILYPIDSPAFDLSDRGVSGRITPSQFDAYVFTEQGVYRPGDSVQVTALLRDKQAKAINGLPLIMQLSDPQGEVVKEQVIFSQGAGGYSQKLAFSQTSKTGQWTVLLFAQKDKEIIGQTSFLIEAIVPPKIEAKLSIKSLPIVSKSSLENASESTSDTLVSLQADYYFGAPASERPIDILWSYQQIRKPFKAYKDYVFGDANNSQQLNEIQSIERSHPSKLPTHTDAQGKANFILPLLSDIKGLKLKIYQPLQARISVQVFDVDGRATTAVKYQPVFHLPHYLGIKLAKPANEVITNMNPAVNFNIVALNQQGLLENLPQLKWRVIKKKTHRQWFYQLGDWDVETSTTEQLVDHGELAAEHVNADLIHNLSLQLAPGQYRLEVFLQQANKQLNNQTSSSMDFQVGDEIISRADSPDALKLSLDQTEYFAGDTAKLTIHSASNGLADIVIATDKVHLVKQVEISQRIQTIEIPIDPNWGAGAYALVSAYHGEKQPTKRSVGVIWINNSSKLHQLEVQVDLPKRIEPRQEFLLPISISGSQASSVYVSVAIVDEAVHQLTGFTPANPLSYYYSKQGLGLSMADNYNHLIEQITDKNRQQFGGDSMAKAHFPASNIHVLSLSSGIVKLNNSAFNEKNLGADKEKVITAQIPFTIPDFNGRVKVVVIAWDSQKLGQQTDSLLINDAVVVQPSLPRFMAVGDQSQLTVLLQNLRGPEGDYSLSLKTEKGIKVALDKATIKFKLHKNQQKSLSFPIKATAIGNVAMTLVLDKGDQYYSEYPLNIGVRYASLPVTKEVMTQLAPQQKSLLRPPYNQANKKPLYIENSIKETLLISARFDLNMTGILESLARYPYGCLEQLVSKASPLLYYNQLAQQWALKPDKHLKQRINKAISLILEKQHPDGSFGLWSSSDSSEQWLTVYAIDFLMQAEQLGYTVEKRQLKHALGWLEYFVSNAYNPTTQEQMSLAYAHYVLAKNGRGKIEDARYFANEYASQLPTLSSYAHLATALAIMGEQQQAQQFFQSALANKPVTQTDTQEKIQQTQIGELSIQRKISWQWIDYGSVFRDISIFTSLLQESGLAMPTSALLYQQLLNWIKHKVAHNLGSFSTQEQAALVRLALTLDGSRNSEKGDNTLHLSINGKPFASGKKHSLIKLLPALEFNDADIKQGKNQFKNTQPVTLLNQSAKQSVWLTHKTTAVVHKKLALQQGFTISKKYYHLDGREANMQQLKQGVRLIVSIQGQANTQLSHRAMLVDLLPAGLEIETTDIKRYVSNEQFKTLPPLTSIRYQKVLDDRFISALDFKADQNQDFSIAYLVRAVTPGEYTLPASEIFDMYDSHYHGNSAQAQIVISGLRSK